MNKRGSRNKAGYKWFTRRLPPSQSNVTVLVSVSLSLLMLEMIAG